MTTTPKGVPYPEPTDPNNVPADVKAVANWVDANPGVAAMTLVERNALTGAQVWPGRTIFNTTTSRHEVNPTGAAGAQKWLPLPRQPQVWSQAGPGAATWTCPVGATRIRMILVGAGGRGSNNGSTTRAIGGGGGGVIDITLPTSMITTGEIAVSVGGPTAGAGGDTTARVEDPANAVPEFVAYGGQPGSDPGLGAGGGFAAPYLNQTEMPAWYGYMGNRAPNPSTTTTPPIARGPGAGITVSGAATHEHTQRGGGFISQAADPTLGFMGGGGRTPGAAGSFPGGGGAGASTATPGAPGAGAPGVAVIIAYFDE